MNEFKKNIFKKRTFVDVKPPTPDCLCDTCEPTENCFAMTVSNTADQTDIGVYYQSAELGQLTPIVPLGALLARDNNDGTTTYFACSISFVSIYDMNTNQQISWPEGSFSQYYCSTVTPTIIQDFCGTTCEVNIVTSEPVVVTFTKALQGGALLVPPSITSTNLVVTDNFSETISSNKGYIFEIDSQIDPTQNYFRSSVLIQLLNPTTFETISQETVQRYHTDAKC